MLAKAPADRPTSADQIAESLRPPAGGCDLLALAARATEGDDHTDTRRANATLTQHILGTLHSLTRRRWIYIALGAGVAGVVGGVRVWRLAGPRRDPYEMLMAEEPEQTRAEYNASDQSLQVYSTGLSHILLPGQSR